MMNKFLVRLLFAVSLLACAVSVQAQSTGKSAAAALRSKYQSLQEQLKSNQFNRPVYLDSTQTAEDVVGDVYSVVNYPFKTTRSALSQASNWCEILFLHLNVKYCRAAQEANGNVMTLYVGKKTPQALEDAYRIDYQFRLAEATPDYMEALMTANAGPLGTSNYRIMLEAIPLGANRSFIHVKYSYSYGLMAKVAMQTYLSTLGSSKIGFTVEGEDESGKPLHVAGLRGAMERNTMRYYLAIDAYLKSIKAPAPANEQLERRLREWFRSTEQYAPQLHEITQQQYLDMKRKEYERQKAG